jgi:hypothetical protein
LERLQPRADDQGPPKEEPPSDQELYPWGAAEEKEFQEATRRASIEVCNLKLRRNSIGVSEYIENRAALFLVQR